MAQVNFDKIAKDDWDRGFQAFKESPKISTIQKVLNCGFPIARALVKDGIPERDWPSYEAKMHTEEAREKAIRRALFERKIDPRIEYLQYVKMYQNLLTGNDKFLSTNGKEGIEPSSRTVDGVVKLIGLGESLHDKEREMMNLTVLPFEDMADEELGEWAKGKRRPRR
jgi:hypothetical protein